MTVAAHAARTDVGRRRDHNEDSVVAEDPLFGVADGVGGAAYGEEASRIALEQVRRAADEISRASDDGTAERAMNAAICAANAAVNAAQADDAERAGMATTITVVVVLADPKDEPRRVVLGHVGDSRAYRVDAAGRIEQVSDDHSVVGELVRSGQLSAAQAAVHPQRNVITRALGPDADVEVDTRVLQVRAGEWLVLCSDGLTDHVEDQEIARAVSGGPDPDRAAQALVDLANERGGTDNITVVLVQPAAGHEPSGGATEAAASTRSLAAAVDDGQDPSELSGELDVVPIDRSSAPHEPDTVELHPGWRGDAEAAGIARVPVTSPTPAPRAADERSAGATRPATARVPDTHASGLPAWAKAGLALLAAVLAFAIGAAVWQHTFFLVARDDGTLGIDRGFPVFGLHDEYRSGDIRIKDLSERDREESVESRSLHTREEAQREYDRLAETARDCAEAERARQDAASADERAAGGDLQEPDLHDPDCPAG